MSSNAKAVTLDELQKGGVGSFTILPPVTISSVGRHRFAYHICVECGLRALPNAEGYGCAQHPDAGIKARYCLRVQLKQDDGDDSMWVTVFADDAESILGVSVEESNTRQSFATRSVVNKRVNAFIETLRRRQRTLQRTSIGRPLGAMFVHKVRELYVLRLQSIRIEVITVPLGVHVHSDPMFSRLVGIVGVGHDCRRVRVDDFRQTVFGNDIVRAHHRVAR